MFLSASIASESLNKLEGLCVVLGVGVISVFDTVAFLACMHRVSSAGNTNCYHLNQSKVQKFKNSNMLE